MSTEDQRKMIAIYRLKCICGSCPTYSSCMRRDIHLLFCLISRSGCPAEERSCICPTCPVAGLMGLRKSYYCIYGTEEEQRSP